MPETVQDKPKRAGRGHPKIDKGKALQLYTQGYSKSEIADKLGVTPGAISQSINPLLENLLSPEHLKTYQDRQVDIVDSATARMLVESLDTDKLKKASTYQLVSSFGILFDKSRLLKGLSTSNVIYADMSQKESEIESEIRKLEESLARPQDTAQDAQFESVPSETGT